MTDLEIRNEGFNERFDHFNDLSQRSVTALEVLVGSLEDIKPPSDVLTSKLEPITNKIEAIIIGMEKAQANATDQFSMASDAMETLRQQTEQVNKLLGDLGDSEGSVSQVNTVMSLLSDGLSTMIGGIEKANEEVQLISDQQGKVFELYQNTANGAAQAISDHNEQIRKELQNTREMTSEVQKNLVDLAQGLSAVVR